MELIFDIGANIGLFTKKCLDTYVNCKVVAIEPNTNLVNLLKNKFINNNVKILDYLVSTKNNDTVDFFVSNADTISTASIDWIEKSRFSKDYFWSQPVKKSTINLDELVKQYGTPDLIKIDVEGYEYEVICGLSKKQKKICFEWAEEEYDKINKTCDYLKTLGYKDFGVVYEDDYLKEPSEYTSWENNLIHKDINTKRKEKWGMIWAK